MCLWRHLNWHSYSNKDWGKVINNELFQNLGPNCNNVFSKWQDAFKYFVAADLHYSRGLNHTRFDSNIILTSFFKTISDALEIGNIELNFLFSEERTMVIHIHQFCQFPSKRKLPFKIWKVLAFALEQIDCLGKSFYVIMSSIVTVIKRIKNTIKTSAGNV